MTRTLTLNITTTKDSFSVEVCEPESGECVTLAPDFGFEPEEHPGFDRRIGEEIYSWISLWMEEDEERMVDSKFGLTDERYEQMREIYDDERIKEIVEDWGAESVNKGYEIFTFNGWNLYEISRIDDVDAFETDDDAVQQAIKDGVKIIPVDELPESFGRRYLGWIDTPENRAKIAELAESHPYDSLV